MSENNNYTVLARKYRPTDFHDLIGQDAMVRTLTNAFSSGRVAHAFILTGIRGTGKTTTARIIAKGLNCIGEDDTRTTPTVEPCGKCGPCKAIAEGRSVDVLELDAASNTQVDKMREILAGVPYRPAEARYKVYIFDEVHMLSASSFNALLKTLEEPPPHVKFIFATTEIRKVPVTVLSRCQRFDLRRIEPEVMVEHLQSICAREAVAVQPEALRLITRAAEGSVRDAQSLLDQAIAIGEGETTAEDVRRMMGLADRARVLDLFEHIISGRVNDALEELGGQFHDGGDPAVILRDLAEITHWVSMLKVSSGTIEEDERLSPEERTRGAKFATKLTLPILNRQWQMLLKLIEEIEYAPNRLIGAEMAIIRLCHVSDEPPPGELVRILQDEIMKAKSGAQVAGVAAKDAPQAVHKQTATGDVVSETALARYARFDDVVTLVKERREIALLIEIEESIRLASYRPGRFEFALTASAKPDLVQRFARKLETWTGVRWRLSLVNDCDTPTIVEKRNAERLEAEDMARGYPLVQAALAAFPKAEIDDLVDFTKEDTLESGARDDDMIDEMEGTDSDDWSPLDDEME